MRKQKRSVKDKKSLGSTKGARCSESQRLIKEYPNFLQGSVPWSLIKSIIALKKRVCKKVKGDLMLQVWQDLQDQESCRSKAEQFMLLDINVRFKKKKRRETQRLHVY